jgi:hypothetical protein
LAQSTPGPELGRLCDEALRRRVATLPRLRAVVEAHRGGGRQWLEPIRAVLADRTPGYDPGANDWEQRMDRLWGQFGLPPAERQYRVRVARRTYRLDRAIVTLKIGVERNGFDPPVFGTSSTATAIVGPSWQGRAGGAWTSRPDRGPT